MVTLLEPANCLLPHCRLVPLARCCGKQLEIRYSQSCACAVEEVEFEFGKPRENPSRPLLYHLLKNMFLSPP